MNIGDSQRARRIIDGTQEGRNILTILESEGITFNYFSAIPFPEHFNPSTGKCI